MHRLQNPMGFCCAISVFLLLGSATFGSKANYFPIRGRRVFQKEAPPSPAALSASPQPNPVQFANLLTTILELRGGQDSDEEEGDFRVEVQEGSLEDKVKATLSAWIQFWLKLYRNLVQSVLGNVIGSSESALQRFEREHGTFHPNFYAGTFTQATDFSRRKGRFTVIFIRPEGAKGKSKKQDDRICSALTDKKVINLIHKKFIFWSTTQSSKQASKLASVLGGKRYPLLAVIHTSANSNKRKVIATHHLNPAPLGPQMVNWLNQTMISNSGLLLEDKRNQQKINAEIQLMKEQRRAYEASIRADMQNELEEQRREKEDAARAAAEQERLLQLEEEKKQIAARREAKREALGPEPTPFIGEGKAVITVQFRFPDGRRETRRFLDTNTIGQVFDWADVLEVDIEDAKLISSFPKRTFDVQHDQEVQLSELGVSKSLAFFVQQNKKPDEEESNNDASSNPPKVSQ